MVSIIIPVFNGADFVGEAIESSIGQTYKNIEIVVVNDGSTDQTKQVLEKYRDHPQVKIIHKENGGVSTALNVGIEAMRGELLAWLSHDDLFLPDKIRRQVEVMQDQPEDVILFSDFEWIDKFGKSLYTERISLDYPQNFQQELLLNHPCHGCTTLVPKKVFELCGLFDDNLRHTQDYDFWFRAAEKVRFVHMAEVTMRSRVHENQGTHKHSKAHLAEVKSFYYQKIDQLLEASGANVDKEFWVRLAKKYRQRGLTALSLYVRCIAMQNEGKGLDKLVSAPFAALARALSFPMARFNL